MAGRISVNFGAVLDILRKHAAEVSDRTGILSVNGIIVDAVIDRLRECATLTPEERTTLLMWTPRVGGTIPLPKEAKT